MKEDRLKDNKVKREKFNRDKKEFNKLIIDSINIQYYKDDNNNVIDKVYINEHENPIVNKYIKELYNKYKKIDKNNNSKGCISKSRLLDISKLTNCGSCFDLTNSSNKLDYYHIINEYQQSL